MADRIVKVFVSGQAQEALAARHRVIERYPAFVIVETSRAEADALARGELVEDITDQYAIPLGGDAQAEIDASKPRITLRGTTVSHPAYRGARRLAPGPHHYLVQFVGPVKPEWLDAVAAAGGEVVDTYAVFTVVVRADDTQIAQIVQLPSVRWAGHLPDEARMSYVEPDSRPLPRTKLLHRTVTVEFFTAREARAARSAIRELGLADHVRRARREAAGGRGAGRHRSRPTSSDDVARGGAWRADGAPQGDQPHQQRRRRRAHEGEPCSARGRPRPRRGRRDRGRLRHRFRRRQHQPRAPRLRRTRESVTSYPITPDFSPYIRNPRGDDGAADLDSGHGTHVAGSVLGDGTASTALAGQAPVRGVAHKARLVFQAIEQELDWRNPADLQEYGRYLLAGIPSDLTTLFQDAYSKGARIHSNSWGGGEPGVYDSQSRQVDEFVRDHPTMCILFAAGNDGTDADGDGKINLGSVTSPGTAKNCITVGACENRRRAFDGETYGEWWPNDYPVAPFRNAPMADDPRQVVAFSSRGPTADGRVKPDVVAPGTFILSTRSTMLSSTAPWAAFPASSSTSTWAARAWRRRSPPAPSPRCASTCGATRGINNPTAALLKAVLIVGASAGWHRPPAGLLDNHQGFGRVHLALLVKPPAGTKLWLTQSSSVGTGQSRRCTITVKTGGAPLRIVLAYTDHPGATLVNNLNLVVTAPDGTKRVGNQAEGGPLVFDTANNVEVVQVAKAAAGAWTIEVVGSNVPQGPQRYALAALGKLT